MDTERLVRELKSVDTLVAEGTITQERGLVWKERLIAEFEGKEIPAAEQKGMPNDIAHLPGRLVGGVIGVLGNINGARCAGVAPEQIAANNTKKRTKPFEDLPEMYK